MVGEIRGSELWDKELERLWLWVGHGFSRDAQSLDN